VINPASLALDTYTTSVVPAAEGYFPGMPQGPDKDASKAPAKARTVVAIYTNAEPALIADKKSVAGMFVIAEFAHDVDLSLPTTDSDKVTIVQNKDVKTVDGKTYAASPTVLDNVGHRDNNVAIRGVDDWEQSHWWMTHVRHGWNTASICQNHF
jgi:hypothetical protein